MSDDPTTRRTKAPAGRERSPNYPGIDLESAVDLVRRLFTRERRTAVSIDDAVKAWGHEGLSGAARVKVAALRQYGLLDPLTGGKVRVSDLGLTFCIEASDSNVYLAALQDAALRPPLFQQLWETMRHASDTSLRSSLMRERGFSLDGAHRLIKAYRATLAFAKMDIDGYDVSARQDKDGDADMNLLDSVNTSGRGSYSPPPPPPASSSLPSARDKDAVSYSYQLGPGVDVEVRLRGPYTVEDLELLRDYIELQERALRRSILNKPSSLGPMPPSIGPPSSQDPGMVSYTNVDEDPS